MRFLRLQLPTIFTLLGLKSLKSNQFLFTTRLNFSAKFYCNRLNFAACTAPTKLRYILIYKLLNGERFWGPGAMIGETMMKFSWSRTMRVSAIGIFLRNLPNKLNIVQCVSNFFKKWRAIQWLFPNWLLFLVF